jgi:hypothetical protein
MLRQAYFYSFIVYILTLGLVTLCSIHYVNAFEKYEAPQHNNKPFVLCANPKHKSLNDCQKDLARRAWLKTNDFSCELTNIMYYTIQIRRKNNRPYYYSKQTHILNHIRESNSNFPLDCRHIGSMLTNIYQCSNNSLERICAQAVNMFIQSEKLHIMSKRSEHLDDSCYFEKKPDVIIFEPYECTGDLYRNVYIRDTTEFELFPNILYLYKQALRLLLEEPRSITYNIFNHSNPEEKKLLKKFIS